MRTLLVLGVTFVDFCCWGVLGVFGTSIGAAGAALTGNFSTTSAFTGTDLIGDSTVFLFD